LSPRISPARITNDGLAGAPMPDDQYNSVPMATSKLLYVIQNGSHFVANDPKGEGAAGEVSFIKKPSDASEWQTTLQ
jgi:hypothetical protein